MKSTKRPYVDPFVPLVFKNKKALKTLFKIHDMKLKRTSLVRYNAALKRFKAYSKTNQILDIAEHERFLLFAHESLLVKKQSASPISCLLSAIKHRDKRMGIISWTAHPAFQGIVAAAKKRGGEDHLIRQVKQKFPWSLQEMEELADELFYEGATDCSAGLVICFNLLLRVSHIKDLKYTDIFPLDEDYVQLRVRRFKTKEQTGEYIWFKIAKKSDIYDRLMFNQRTFGRVSGPIFPNFSQRHCNARMKSFAERKKIWREDLVYSMHGLRAGGAQHRLEAGEAIEQICKVGVWARNSATLKKVYLRGIDTTRKKAGKKLRLAG